MLLGLVSLPVIHLGLMEYRESLRPVTMVAILFTCVVGTAMITLFFLDTTWLGNVRHSLDNQLKTTADGIKKKFGTETRNTLDRLRRYDESGALEDDFKCVPQGENDPDIDQKTCAEENRTYGKSASGGWVARKEYPEVCDKDSGKFCDLVFWVDQEKNSRITWNTGSKFHLQTAEVSLAHRDYVNRILDPDPESSLWQAKLKDGSHVPFYAQPVHSLGTGKHLVIVSMESSRHPKSSPDEQEKWVAALETEFQFLKSVAIPKGTGFAVIEDNGGKVLFHSDANRNLWENFIEETDNNAQLTANVFSRTPGTFEGTYWGKGHAFYSTPLPGVPWSLVVFRNKELFRTTNFEALLLASALFAVYLVIVSIGLVVTYMMSAAVRCLGNKATGPLGKTAASWCWPDSRRPGWDYSVIGLMAVFLFVAGIIVVAYGSVPGDSAVWVVVPYLLFSGILIWMTTKYCEKRAPKPSSDIPPEQGQQVRSRYAFAMIAWLLLFSALPMATFFKIGTDRELRLAMKYNLITLGHKLRRVPGPGCSHVQAAGNGTEQGSSEADPLLQCGMHVNVLADTDLVVSPDRPEDTDPQPSVLDKFHRFIRENSLSRLSNPVSIEMLGLLGNQPPEKSERMFYWEDGASSPLSLTFQAPLQQSGAQPGWVTLTASPLPDIWFSTKGFPDKRHVVSLLVGIAGVLVIVLVPPCIVRRIFPILPQSSNNEGIGPPESYEHIWQAQSPDEQTTLYNLAKDGFVHAENPDLVVLSQRGLIKARPVPRLVNENFEKYVLRTVERDGLEPRQQKSQSQWQIWKWPLAIIFVVLALGLLLTQKEFSNAVALMLSVLPVLLPTLSGLTGSPQTGGKAGSNG